MNKQPFRFMPATPIGMWTVWLVIAMFLLFFIGTSTTNTLYASVPSGNTILEDIGARPLLALSMLAGMLAGASGFVTGLLAIFQKKERTVLVYAATLIGGFIIIFLIGEMLFPH